MVSHACARDELMNVFFENFFIVIPLATARDEVEPSARKKTFSSGLLADASQ